MCSLVGVLKANPLISFAKKFSLLRSPSLVGFGLSTKLKASIVGCRVCVGLQNAMYKTNMHNMPTNI
jgi:hypothetical protein